MRASATVQSMNSTHYHPLKDGNRLQRAYYRWALPHYERMPPDLREHAEPIDQFLYTRQGFGTWLGWLGGLAGLVFGLHAGLHLPWGLALGPCAGPWHRTLGRIDPGRLGHLASAGGIFEPPQGTSPISLVGPYRVDRLERCVPLLGTAWQPGQHGEWPV